MFTKQPDDCIHFRCTGKRSGPHSDDCPTHLNLTDGDVLAFAASFIVADPCATNDGYVVLHGSYKGGTASAGPTRMPLGTGRAPTAEERWLAEELISWARRNAVGECG